MSHDDRKKASRDLRILGSAPGTRRRASRWGRVGVAGLLFWWLAVGGQDGCATSDPGPQVPSDKYILPRPAIVVAKPENCLADVEPPTTTGTAELSRVGDDRNLFQVVIPVADKDVAIQQSKMYCWAACTQMLLTQIGQTVDQEEVAKEYEANQADQSASVGVVIRALNPDLEPQVEAKGAVPIDVFATTSDQMLEELLAGHLCIEGRMDGSSGTGHACVVCGATFAKLKPSTVRVTAQASGMGPHAREAMLTAAKPTYAIYYVELIDPEDGLHHTLTAQALADQAQFIIDRPYARDMLQAALSSDPRFSNHQLIVQDAHSYMKSTSSAGPGHFENHFECTSHG